MSRKTRKKSRAWQHDTRRLSTYLLSCILTSILLVSVVIILRQTSLEGFGSGLFLSQKIIQPTPIVLPILTPMVTPTTPTTPQEQLSGFCISVPVLMYHHIQPMEQAIKNDETALTVDTNVFDAQMGYLNSMGYRTIRAEELVRALREKQSVPNKSIIITIDDGYSDIYTYAYPIAKKYSIVLNLMIPTGLVNNKGYMSWDNIREMVAAGQTTVANHTWSHFQLTRGDSVKQQMEIVTAKTQLIQNAGTDSTIFSYPYGSYNDISVQTLLQNNFSGAFSTFPGRIQCDSILFALHRDRIGNVPLSSYGL
jgi:peptidoglycan/xylan/chitin deacetylase (PgdA/CDA1 family)